MYKVKLQSFEGPFDLLVYLIESAEMSIYDIRISEITSQYLDYIRAMEEQNIEVAQEFMVLAASLIEIKSRMILPRVNEEGEPVIEEDPRKELVQRILEYKHFKEISEAFKIREERMSHV
ncbi:MAG: segregation/condensation protein A, partial [Firmicutes bacterium]|nr:segregation/condensation protein A [Bacillota bacterium]